MAYDEGLAERIREALADQPNVLEKRMFGGLAFMVGGNMCVGVVKDQLMVRVGPEAYDERVQERHARRMDFTGRPLKGFIYVAPEGFESDTDLRRWVGYGLAYAVSLRRK